MLKQPSYAIRMSRDACLIAVLNKLTRLDGVNTDQRASNATYLKCKKKNDSQ